MRRLLVVLVATFVALPGVGAHAAPNDPSPGTPEWYLRDVDNMNRATGRMQDFYTNPAFGQYFWTETLHDFTGNVSDQLHHPDRPIITAAQWIPGGTTTDPYRHHWEDSGRGIRVPFEYINREGVRIQGNLWGPNDMQPGAQPAVVITTGSIQGYEEMYWWAAQGLAEAGYVVMTWDVQGQGESETFAHHPDGSLWCGVDGCPGVPFQQGKNFYEGTEDALVWFWSNENPMRSYVNFEQVGLAGHSLGAGAVSEIGNRTQPVPSAGTVANNATDSRAEVNPADIRVKAVVGWDNAGASETAPLRVPTMGQRAEYFFNPTPTSSAESPGAALGIRDYSNGQPWMQVSLRSATHLEWTFVPYILPASRKGERVAMYYTLAWFDRFIKGDVSAADRLTALEFDGSSDSSSIGMGSWEAPTNRNVPHMIEGECVAEHLSIYKRSSYNLDGGATSTSPTVANMRDRGCPVL